MVLWNHSPLPSLPSMHEVMPHVVMPMKVHSSTVRLCLFCLFLSSTNYPSSTFFPVRGKKTDFFLLLIATFFHRVQYFQINPRNSPELQAITTYLYLYWECILPKFRRRVARPSNSFFFFLFLFFPSSCYSFKYHISVNNVLWEISTLPEHYLVSPEILETFADNSKDRKKLYY